MRGFAITQYLWTNRRSIQLAQGSLLIILLTVAMANWS